MVDLKWAELSIIILMGLLLFSLGDFGGPKSVSTLLLWDSFGHCQNKNIWCSVIALERRKRNGDEQVWGNVEWSSVVLTVSSSYHILGCEIELEEAPPQTKFLWISTLWEFLSTSTLWEFLSISTCAPALNSDAEEDTSLFSSLPDELVVNCLARISRSYYPKLSLVSKTFRSLISSIDLCAQRKQLKTTETSFNVCLKLPGHRLPSWFSLWIKPDQILTNDNKLVRIPSSYIPHIPSMYIGKVGSKYYRLRQYNIVPTVFLMQVRDNGTQYAWREAPPMKVARENAVAGTLDGKIYVMGGCKADKSTNWGEVFDTKTQVWESLPDPGAELRFSLVKTVKVADGKIYVESSCEKNAYFYDPKEGRWGVTEKTPVLQIMCFIDNVWYNCNKFRCYWHDTKYNDWSEVNGLEIFNRDRIRADGSLITVANYGGKLLLLWDSFGHCQNKNIWCSVIAVERRKCNGDEQVWGNVEWSSVVLTVPSSYHFLRSEVKRV